MRISSDIMSFSLNFSQLAPISHSDFVIPLLLLLSAIPPSFESVSTVSGNQTHVQNETSSIHPRSSPPTKSLFSSQLFNTESFMGGSALGTVGGILKTLGGTSPFPLRESYIAFEQAHPLPPTSTDASYGYGTRGQGYDEYFKPSKFPLGLGSTGADGYSYANKLQNSFPSYYGYQPQPPSQYKPPSYYYPVHPPPPPPAAAQPFLRLVKIPGDLTWTVRSSGGRNDLEISCEFPPYLLVVQQIYWHFIPQPASFLPPYGSFYDLRNGFAPRVTVTPVSKWKSILRIRDYTPDDHGTYRCVSTAILPDEPEPRPPSFSTSPYSPYAPASSPPTHFLNFPHDSIELRSAESKIDTETSHDGGEKLTSLETGSAAADLLASSSKKHERKVKFLGRSKREAGAFGVYAPFFKPHYGIYRVYKELVFGEDSFGAGSDVQENVVNTSKEKPERLTASGSNGSSSKVASGKEPKRNGRRFDKDNAIFRRSGKVMF